ncbi:MAG: nucleoside recognition protein [Lachnospiraceae bacterium]|nr:nucleoside recognition protein [Lachnospiraceae bacterium]
MLNYIWAFMIIIGILYGAFTGNIEAVSNAALASAQEAVDLCITMLGIMGLWMGLMEIAQKSGVIAKLTQGIQPFISFMFPRIPKGHIAREYISTNIIANILGLGWACTPAGLKAMEALAQLEAERGNPEYLGDGGVKGHESGTNVHKGAHVECQCGKVRIASDEMCTFLILNISSLQLIPVSMIAYRSQYGSASPTAIVGPAIIATLVSTLVGIVFAKAAERKR